MMDVERTIREYLQEVIHMSLATSMENKPWVCEVHFVFDIDLNLYFRSKPSRRHSQEIAHNNHIAGNIVKQHFVGEKVRGVYFEGSAELLDELHEDDDVYSLFCTRLGVGKEILEDAKAEDGHKFYKVSVDMYYLFDSQESNPSQKYELPWGKAKANNGKE